MSARPLERWKVKPPCQHLAPVQLAGTLLDWQHVNHRGISTRRRPLTSGRRQVGRVSGGVRHGDDTQQSKSTEAQVHCISAAADKCQMSSQICLQSPNWQLGR